MDWSTPGFPTLHYLLEFPQTHVHWVDDAINRINYFNRTNWVTWKYWWSNKIKTRESHGQRSLCRQQCIGLDAWSQTWLKWQHTCKHMCIYEHGNKKAMFPGRKTRTNLDSILKSRDITLPTKVCLVKAMVFPVVMYGCESWTVKKAEHRRIDAFDLWCWRRLLRVSWTARDQTIQS